jgi:hypothetical protein
MHGCTVKLVVISLYLSISTPTCKLAHVTTNPSTPITYPHDLWFSWHANVYIILFFFYLI